MQGSASRSPQSGFSLTELMVTLTVGLMLLAGMLGYLSTVLSSNQDTLRNSRLNQELNLVMDVMARDLRRAGYWGESLSGIGSPAAYAGNPFQASIVAGADDGGINIDTAGCLLYTYDRNANGLKDSTTSPSIETEKLGFKFDNATVKMLRTADSTPGCATGTWEDISDPKVTKITGLTFSYLDAAGVPATGPIAQPQGSGVLCIRVIRITLAGELISNPLAKQQLTQDVRIRNDSFRTTGSTC